MKENPTKGWSWAWSFANTITLIASWNYGLLVVKFILMLVPIINVLTLIWYFIFWWLKWKELIYNNPSFQNEDQKIWAIKALENVWFIFMILYLVLFVFFILFFWMITSLILGWMNWM